MSRMILLSGPVGVGKGELYRAVTTFYPEIDESTEPIKVITSGPFHPGEFSDVEYLVLPEEEVEALSKQKNTISIKIQNSIRVIRTEDVLAILDREKEPFLLCSTQMAVEVINSHLLSEITRISVFLSPLSWDEVVYITDPARGISLPEFVSELMRRKLLNLMKSSKGVLSKPDLEIVERLALIAYPEMQNAWQFNAVLPLHDGEDSHHWQAFKYPIGDARKALLAFAALIQGRGAELAERWVRGLLP